ncbi:hypothetical protein PINS_up024021 [Pythium insidiosum]|nr:hypothetical protein PINS_up024021 [Pythium insidiosum]
MVTTTSASMIRSERSPLHEASSNNVSPLAKDALLRLRRWSDLAKSGGAESVDLRSKAFHGVSDDARPVVWRILLGVIDEDPSTWISVLKEKRAQYHQWRREFQGFHRARDVASAEPEDAESNGKKNSAEHIDAREIFQRDVSLLKEIDKDVSRTQSELPFFAVGSMQQQWMMRILFVHAKLHPELGYMQGMNEILAPIIFVYGSDPSEEWAREAEADAFHSFQSIMSSAKILYSRSPTDPTKTGVDMQMARLAVLLRQHDALLWQHLNSIGLTPEFYSFRWYMTLLAREFPMPITLRIWDTLLSDARRFSFLHYINCALVRSQRATLLQEGFTGALRVLQALPGADTIEDVLASAVAMRDRDRATDQCRVVSPRATPDGFNA